MNLIRDGKFIENIIYHMCQNIICKSTIDKSIIYLNYL